MRFNKEMIDLPLNRKIKGLTVEGHFGPKDQNGILVIRMKSQGAKGENIIHFKT